MPPPTTPVPTSTESFLDRVIDASSWIWLVLVGVIVGGVVLRTFFGINRIELEELQWHLYAVGFLAGIVGCVLHDRHVRVDVFREGMASRRRDWVDGYGLLLFQLPFVLLLLASALPLVAESFSTSERSTSAGGLPARWLFKSALPIAAVAILAASLEKLRRVAGRLFPSSVETGDRGEDAERERAARSSDAPR